MTEKSENHQQIKDLEDEIQILAEKETKANNELERQELERYKRYNSLDIYPITSCLLVRKLTLFWFGRVKERMKKMSCQMRHDEEKRKCLQVIIVCNNSKSTLTGLEKFSLRLNLNR